MKEWKILRGSLNPSHGGWVQRGLGWRGLVHYSREAVKQAFMQAELRKRPQFDLTDTSQHC